MNTDDPDLVIHVTITYPDEACTIPATLVTHPDGSRAVIPQEATR